MPCARGHGRTLFVPCARGHGRTLFAFAAAGMLAGDVLARRPLPAGARLLPAVP